MRLRGAWSSFRAGAGRLSDDQFRLKLDALRKFFTRRTDGCKKSLGCCATHCLKGLADCAQAWNEEGCVSYVVETENRDVIGHGEAMVDEGSDCSHCGRVVECEEGRKVLGLGQ
jgi:hypothetical protein